MGLGFKVYGLVQGSGHCMVWVFQLAQGLKLNVICESLDEDGDL